jgi:serine/threonine protein kinase
LDKGYDVFCIADPDFYDTPTRLTEGHGGGDFELAASALPAGWQREFMGDWSVLRPVGHDMAAQGWKVHVSARVDNAATILDRTWEYCREREIPFKFLRGQHIVRTHNLKYMPRGSSGKFITIYPPENVLERTLRELDDLIGGLPGPYILSDLRWGAGPLYVRYGAFVERYCLSAAGTLTPAIETPTGSLVPDPRPAAFSPPSWVELPDFLAPHLAARDAVTFDAVDFRVEKALHFSNGGGIYVGVDTRTEEQVILKEARPHAGLSGDGADAVERLERERTILRVLDGIEGVPGYRDHFVLGDHHFLVQDFINGKPLHKHMVRRYPLYGPDTALDAVADYTNWAVDVCRKAERLIEQVHGRGVVYGDLHPYNLLLDDQGRISLIDFEVATELREKKRPMLGNPAFLAPPDRTGFDIDAYALACLRLYLFLPLTTLLRRHPAKAAELAAAIREIFPVDAEFVADAVRVIQGPASQPKGNPRPETPAHRPDADLVGAFPFDALAAGQGWPTVRDSIARAILASATPEREDRLFPGDIEQFSTGGLNLAHGAAGVLYALAATGAVRYPEGEQWLLRRALQPDPRGRLGLYEGLHGVVFTLDYLGHQQQARELLERCLAASWQRLGPDLRSGLAGAGLNLLHFAARTGESALRQQAMAVADLLADRLTDEGAAVPAAERRAGLMRGASGPALFLLRMHELTGDQALLDLAGTALYQDLDRCLTLPDGTLHVDEGWRSMPYLATGGVGVGLVCEEYLKVRQDERIAAAAQGGRQAAQSQYYAQSGLFNGRAGMIAHLSRAHPDGAAIADPRIAAQVRALGWHAQRHHGELVFPGDQLLRLSMDLATGGAGVLLGLGTALLPTPPALPGLDPLPAQAPSSADDSGRAQAPGRLSTDSLSTREGGVFDHVSS